ncbi:hypothetical protein [Rubritalea tangerina]|uniref:Uncharacterized protein n=1 Tax=Rubritalea tangerina TaxID=430798 RepID=A0ABW4Z976_9BACT
MDEELRAIENQLEKLSPTAMPEDMLARMEQAMEKWQDHLPAEEKIVPFVQEPQERGKLKLFNTWASAAAVALVGAASYMMLNSGTMTDSEVVVAGAGEQMAQAVPAQNINAVVPASNSRFDTQVKRASDDVITYDANGRPVRLMRVEFEDEVTVRGKDGRTYKVKQPRIEYYAVPVEVH